METPLNQYCSLPKKNRIWVFEPCTLITNFWKIIPTENMSKNEKVNTLTRLVLVIFFLMVLFRYPRAIDFLLLSIIIILILYFVSTKENFQLPMADYPPTYKFPLQQNAKAESKMSIAPIIIPRSHDREVWSFPSYRHSAVNNNNMHYDLSEEYAPVQGFLRDPVEYDPYNNRINKYTNFDLDQMKQIASPPAPALVGGSMDGYNPPATTAISAVAPVGSTERFGSVRERFAPTSSPVQYPPTFPKTQNNADFTPIGVVAPTSQYYTPQTTYPNVGSGPPTNLLIPRTVTSIYGPGQVTAEERVKYMENVQPNEYSYAETAEPINSNIGISYNPDLPPLVRDQVVVNGGIEPLYHRMDPQLIRDENIPAERYAEMPRRTSWSARYGIFDAAPGTVNFEDIYDPRFNSYGDQYRSYGDVNLGQVQYYYSDIDAYRNPNFDTRSKVDFIDFHDPMGRVIPEYNRQVGVNDIKAEVQAQYDADAIYHREDLSEKLLRKRNSELWQLRAMPLRKNANASTFTSNY